MTDITNECVKWTLTSGDVVIEVVATISESGDVTITYDLVSGVADLNGFFIDFGNDGGDISKLGGGNNMKGSDSDGDKLDGFDYAEELGTVGGNDEDHTSGTVTFTAAQLADFGVDGLADLADAEIGFRATSVGEDREDSLKLADTGTYCPDTPNGNDFPEWAQDISNITFVFNQSEGDTPDPHGNPDGYYTVKVDVPGELGDDPDAYIEEFLAALIEHDPNLAEDADLMGIVIKGGQQVTEYYAYGDYNANGEDPDDLPDGIAFSLDGTSANVDPTNAIDTGYSLTLSGDEFVFA